MAILVVDDENNTREALRTLLDGLGAGPILEAKNGEEALKILAASGSRVRMIVADWEMPYMDGLTLVQRIAERPELSLVPFLLITSDLPRTKIEEFRAENPRLDHHLIKPFRMKGLAEAMGEAARKRAQARSKLVLVRGDDWLERLVRQGVDEARAEGTHWSDVVVVRDQSELGAVLDREGWRVGTILLEAGALAKLDPDWLAAFKKTPVGAVTPLVALSRNPVVIRPVRTQCHFFIEPEGEGGAGRLLEILTVVSRRLANAWDLERLLDATKALMRAGDFKGARKNLEALFKLDHFNSEVSLTAGEICEGMEDAEGALRNYSRAAEINPCVPRVHIKLLAAAEGRLREQFAVTAAEFCPQNVDVLLAVAQAWMELGSKDRARETLAVIRGLAPGHKGAAELEARLGKAAT